MNGSGIVDVLLVEDDLADIFMVQEALAELRGPTRLHIATDGVEATAFLRRDGIHADAPRPAFVLLDLNMPRKDGFEVLADIKQDRDLRVIPVIVFSTSQTTEQVRRSYADHANAYVVKPTTFDEFALVVRQIEHFYTQVAAAAPVLAGN